MNRTIASLAILKVNSDHLRKDYIENFVPFIATLIGEKHYEQIEVNRICQDFTQEYGLIIPYHPMITVLNRARKRGLIRGRKGPVVPVKDKVSQFEFTSLAKKQVRNQEKVIDEFIDFAKRIYNVQLTKEDAGSTFISVLKEHDLEILFAAEQSTVLPTVRSSKKRNFLIHSFIKHTYESEPETFRFIVDIAIGHILASALLYRELDQFTGNLKAVNFYFDTRFILRLLGLEGEERKLSYTDFLKTMLKQEAKLFVFRHTYEETMGVLQDCLRWVENPLYDASIASPTLRYFVHNNHKRSDVDRFMVNVRAVLEENGINIQETLDPNEYQNYQIDEGKLHATIVNIYKERDWAFDELEKERTIQRDVTSISAVYRLRKGRNPTLIKEASAIFVTTNSGLAYANSQFEFSERQGCFSIPACLTDVFVGTFVWLQSAARVSHINEKKMVADCYAALEPNKVLIKKYLDEVEKLRKGARISENEYYMLRTHRVAMNLLEDKTMGDPDTFTDKTPEEILEEITEEIRNEGEKRRLQEVKRHKDTLEELKRVRAEKEEVERNIERSGELISSVTAWFIFGILVLMFLVGSVSQLYANLLGDNKWLRTALIAFIVLVAMMSVAFGFNLKGLRHVIRRWIKSKVIEFLTRKKQI